jgi:hypothetical protein
MNYYLHSYLACLTTTLAFSSGLRFTSAWFELLKSLGEEVERKIIRARILQDSEEVKASSYAQRVEVVKRWDRLQRRLKTWSRIVLPHTRNDCQGPDSFFFPCIYVWYYTQVNRAILGFTPKEWHGITRMVEHIIWEELKTKIIKPSVLGVNFVTERNSTNQTPGRQP